MSVSREKDPIERAMNHVSKKSNLWLTHVGLNPEHIDELKEYDIEQLAIYAEIMVDISSWTIADLALLIERRVEKLAELNGWTYAQMVRKRDEQYKRLILSNAPSVGDLNTILTYKAVAKSFPLSKRRRTKRVTFSHHRALASFTDKDIQEEFLDKVEAYGWTVEILRVKLARGDAEDFRFKSDLESFAGKHRNYEIDRKSLDSVADWFDRHKLVLVADEPNRAVIQTADGAVIVESDSELRWEVQE
jgi:hypothetical protein